MDDRLACEVRGESQLLVRRKDKERCKFERLARLLFVWFYMASGEPHLSGCGNTIVAVATIDAVH